ncbi:MAG: hypothetical protein H6822_20220 [Planctomycetaceae bacterium]|nr:hypothetical protein [Planctomycetales bacterium]MCB9924515.1 hypothetical protein [Planctomycetaceae bacterium]
MDRRFDAVERRLDGVDKRLDAVDRRFATMEKQLDDRFDAIDRRFDAADLQFDRTFDCIVAEGKQIRASVDRTTRETRRHIDFTGSSLRRFFKALFDFKVAMFGNKWRKCERHEASAF